MEVAISLFKPPKAPDPYATSAAQTQSNKDTAGYNAALNRVDTYTPYGSSVYSVTGTGPNGAPTYRQDINLTPVAQQQLDNEMRQNLQLSTLGDTLYGQARDKLTQPLPDTATSNQAARDAYYAKQTAYLDPQWQHAQSDLNSDLANKGVMEGSAAWTRAQDDLSRNKTFAYGQAQNDAILNGNAQQQQALQLAAALRQMPINELNAIRTGSQIQNPQFSPTYNASAAPTDVAGNINNAYNAQVSNYNNMMQGLVSAASTAAVASDRRLKHAIRRIGETPVLKLPLYAFRYLGGRYTFVGVMAQDCPPEAVARASDGYLLVDYRALA